MSSEECCKVLCINFGQATNTFSKARHLQVCCFALDGYQWLGQINVVCSGRSEIDIFICDGEELEDAFMLN